jgi:hypothetical protein
MNESMLCPTANESPAIKTTTSAIDCQMGNLTIETHPDLREMIR